MMNKNYMFKYIVIIPLLVSLTGCGATRKLSPTDKNIIKSIAVEQVDVSNKNPVFIQTNAATLSGFLGGPIGALIYEGSRDKTPEEILTNILKKNDMLKSVICESFRYQISGSKLFTISQKKSADAFMTIDVLQIQLIEEDEGKFKLTTRIDAKLITTDGRIVWEDWSYFPASSDELKQYALDEYLNDKNRLSNAISVISQLIAREFISNIGGTPLSVNETLVYGSGGSL